ncbi:MAG: hypothetical protein R3260_03060 [Pseudomonas sp.]|nr:hypothetical protein [Pseudomonas sp.]
MTTGNIKASASKEGRMAVLVDPRQRILRRVEDRLSSEVGKRVRIGSEADRLILSIRDEILSRTYQQNETVIMELRFLLEECLTELDELSKAAI